MSIRLPLSYASPTRDRPCCSLPLLHHVDKTETRHCTRLYKTKQKTFTLNSSLTYRCRETQNRASLENNLNKPINPNIECRGPSSSGLQWRAIKGAFGGDDSLDPIFFMNQLKTIFPVKIVKQNKRVRRPHKQATIKLTVVSPNVLYPPGM